MGVYDSFAGWNGFKYSMDFCFFASTILWVYFHWKTFQFLLKKLMLIFLILDQIYILVVF
jgi:hypothetical protein